MPSYIQFEPTTRCNFTCGFCVGRHLPQEDLSLEHFKQVIDRQDLLKHIELQGEGEPLMHADFFTMVKYARNKFPTVKISLITNGSMFTEDNIKQLIDNNITSLFISIESANDNEFQRIRGGKLQKVIRGIIKLMDAIRESNSKLTVGFAVTVLKSTSQEMIGIASLYNDLRMNGGIFTQPLQSMATYTDIYTDELLAEIPQKQHMDKMYNIIATDFYSQLAFRNFNPGNNFFSELSSSCKTGCPWLNNGLYVSADGGQYTCPFVKNRAYENPDIHKLQKQLQNKTIPEQCTGCKTAERVTK